MLKRYGLEAFVTRLHVSLSMTNSLRKQECMYIESKTGPLGLLNFGMYVKM